MNSYLITYQYNLYDEDLEKISGIDRTFLHKEKITAEEVTKMEKSIKESLILMNNRKIADYSKNDVKILYITKLDN